MEIQEFRILLDRILRFDGAAFLHMAGCYSNGMCVAPNEKKVNSLILILKAISMVS